MALQTKAKMAPSGCIFCQIADGQDPKAQLLYQDDQVAVFYDHHPAAPHHYLVVPREHIKDASHVSKAQIGLIEHMLDRGKQVLLDKGGNLDDVRMGFHHKPLLLVNHLHLHVVSPASQLGFLRRLSFRPDSYWFTTISSRVLAQGDLTKVLKLQQSKLGFHWPPFNSVDHLHLHVVSPGRDIKFRYKVMGKYDRKFKWFKQVDKLLEDLRKMPDQDPAEATADKS